MRLLDIISDKIIELPIIEMAVARKEARDSVFNKSYQIFSHITKILVMPNAQAKKHWFAELNAFIDEIERIRLKGRKLKKLSAEQYWKWLVEEPETQADKVILRTIKPYYLPESIIIPNNIQQQVEDIIRKICIDLGSNNFVTIEKYFK